MRDEAGGEKGYAERHEPMKMMPDTTCIRHEHMKMMPDSTMIGKESMMQNTKFMKHEDMDM
jgi:hypothetical protein